MKLKSKYWASIAFLLFCSGLFGQNDSISRAYADARMKSLFIYGFTKYIEWPNQEKLKDFKIGVLGNDVAIFAELEKMAATRTVQGKPFVIKTFQQITNVTDVQILYVHRKTGFDINQILEKIKARGILLISENYPFQSSMINFVQVDNQPKSELNQQRLEEEGFIVSPTLLAQAIKSPDDWQKIYRETKVELQSEKEKVQQQKEEISQLQQETERQLKKIEEAKEEIVRQKWEIHEQKREYATLVEANEDQQKNLDEKTFVLRKKELAIKQQETQIAKQKEEMIEQNEVLDKQIKQMSQQETKIEKQKEVLSQQLSQIEQERLMRYMFIVLIVLIAGFGIFIFRSYQIKKKINEQLEEQNIAINKQKEEIESQKQLVEKKNEAITASINYAKRIQEAILTSRVYLDKIMPEYFVFYRPRDIVSGDFYWAHETKNGKVVFTVVDCTGHGVPGAFMSMIGNALLNEVVIENKKENSDDILNHLRDGIIRSLKQTGQANESRDGMDMALCVLDKKSGTLEFSGAHNPLYHFRNGSFNEYKGDMQSIGFQRGEPKPFVKHIIQLEKGDVLYLFSDGFVDQKGGPNGKKFYYKPFKELLAFVQDKPFQEQRSIIKQTYIDWRGTREQIDDVCIMAVKF
ncbi:MAG: hypothetical protein COA57_13500 [Flavobacteriales bacterium]|nr:DUF4154 domain-containing protein [Bacteroidales bacterium AH-315-I05]PCJ82131.1 MAG: hypothetical protein COA57_13500 [Flavobacteriales bacterium]